MLHIPYLDSAKIAGSVSNPVQTRLFIILEAEINRRYILVKRNPTGHKAFKPEIPVKNHSLISTSNPIMARKAIPAPNRKGAAGFTVCHNQPAMRLAGSKVTPTTPWKRP